jgi:hypothetical protein
MLDRQRERWREREKKREERVERKQERDIDILRDREKIKETVIVWNRERERVCV